MPYHWEPVHEMDDEVTGQVTCYSAETGSRRRPFVWLTDCGNGWSVETATKYADGFGPCRVYKLCKTLASAKRWVTMNPQIFLTD